RYLIAEVGKIDGNVSDIIMGRISGVKAVLVYEDGKLYVEVQGMRSASSITWSGTNGSVWDLAETENFTATDGTGEVFVDGDVVTFNDKAATGTVELAGELHPSSVVFNNNTLEYNISGSTIAGEASLVKEGSAKTTIANANSFTGGTRINGGTLAVTSLANNDGVDVGSLGGPTAPVTISNGATLAIEASGMVMTTQPLSVGEGGATLDVPSGVTLSMDNTITSSTNAPLYKIGTGTLNLLIGNTIGKIYLNQGTISCATAASSSQRLSRDTLVFNGSGVILDHENSEGVGGSILDYTNYLVPEGKSGKLYLDGRCDYYGGLAGSGQLGIYPRFVRNYLHGNWSKFTGTVRICYNGSNIYGVSAVQLGSGADFSNAIVYVEDQAILSNEGVSVVIKTLDGTGTLNGAGTYTIGGCNDDIYFKGTIASPVVKEGTGKWTVSGSNPQTSMGAVTVNNGMLYLDTYYSSTSIIGSTVTVNNGAEVSGIGTVGTLVLNEGAVATPGIAAYNSTGFIKATSTFNAKVGSTINLSIYSNGSTNYSRSFVASAQYMFMNATVNVALHEKYVPAAGHSFTLWTADQYIGNPVVNLPELPLGLKWDTSELNAATGLLKIVADADGISAPHNAGVMHCRMYTTGGLLVGEFDASAAEVNAKARSLGVAAGAYILKTNSANGAKTVKIVVK
ncbi:MAG: autotransporter-associated beta strand repeat-containing protein, partial [Prevotella sp.]